MPEALKLEGCFNFRDIGGLPAGVGGSVRGGQVFRSDMPTRLTEADERALAGAGVRTVIDFRASEELDRFGVPIWPLLAPEHRWMPMLTWDQLPQGEVKQWLAPETMALAYHRMFADGVAAIGKSLSLLAQPDIAPAIVHCVSGRDRTALFIAVLLGLLGVPDEAIAADYALSADGMRDSMEWMRVHEPAAFASIVQSEEAMVYAPPEAMMLFLDEFRRRHHTFDDFAQSLGCGEAPDLLRERLIDRGPVDGTS